MSLVLEDGSNTLLQQHGPCAEPPTANAAVSGLGAASMSGLPRSPLLRGGLPGADQLLCRALPSSVVSVLSRPAAPGAGSAVRRRGRFDLEEAADRPGVRPQPPLPPAQRLHFPVGHSRAPGRQRGQGGRGPAAPPEEPAPGPGSQAGPPAAGRAGAGAGRPGVQLGARGAVQGQADGRGAGGAVRQGWGPGGHGRQGLGDGWWRCRGAGASVGSRARGAGREVAWLWGGKGERLGQVWA